MEHVAVSGRFCAPLRAGVNAAGGDWGVGGAAGDTLGTTSGAASAGADQHWLERREAWRASARPTASRGRGQRLRRGRRQNRAGVLLQRGGQLAAPCPWTGAFDSCLEGLDLRGERRSPRAWSPLRRAAAPPAPSAPASRGRARRRHAGPVQRRGPPGATSAGVTPRPRTMAWAAAACSMAAAARATSTRWRNGRSPADGRLVEQPREHRSQAAHRLEHRRVVGLGQIESLRAERTFAAQGEREPLDLAAEADAQAKQPRQRDGAQRRRAALIVPLRQALHRQIERGHQAIEHRRHRLVVAGRDPIGGQHAVGERDQREAQIVQLVAGGQLLRRARERRAVGVAEPLGQRRRHPQRGAVRAARRRSSGRGPGTLADAGRWPGSSSR